MPWVQVSVPLHICQVMPNMTLATVHTKLGVGEAFIPSSMAACWDEHVPQLTRHALPCEVQHCAGTVALSAPNDKGVGADEPAAKGSEIKGWS